MRPGLAIGPALPARPAFARRPRWTLVLVLTLHLALLALLPAALRPFQRGPVPADAARTLWLRLLPERPAPAGPPTHRDAGHRAPHVDPAPISLPMPPAAAPSPPDTAAAITAAAAASQPASAPLDLRLPARALHNPTPAALAREDPRLQRPLLPAERQARALASDGTVHEGVHPDGTRIFRRGDDCTVARPSRDGELDPFNQSTLPRPRLIDQVKC